MGDIHTKLDPVWDDVKYGACSVEFSQMLKFDPILASNIGCSGFLCFVRRLVLRTRTTLQLKPIKPCEIHVQP